MTMAKIEVWDASRQGDADFVRAHLDAQIALIGALIAGTPDGDGKVLELKLREARLRAFVLRCHVLDRPMDGDAARPLRPSDRRCSTQPRQENVWKRW
jgi:hypothetical protein